MNKAVLRRAVRLGFLLVALGFGVWAVAGQWAAVAGGLGRLSWGLLAGSLVAALAALGAGMLMWRALLADLGSPLPVVDAAKVFFVGQLGKYIPGSLWPVLAQMEMGRDLGVPRSRSAAAFFLTYPVYLATGLLVAAATLPVFAGDSVARYAWLAALLPLLIAGLHPRVVNAVRRARAAAHPPPAAGAAALPPRGCSPRRAGRSPAGSRTACTWRCSSAGSARTGRRRPCSPSARSRSPGASASWW
jgi:Uncharacterised protein family (UPF0104).